MFFCAISVTIVFEDEEYMFLREKNLRNNENGVHEQRKATAKRKLFASLFSSCGKFFHVGAFS